MKVFTNVESAMQYFENFGEQMPQMPPLVARLLEAKFRTLKVGQAFEFIYGNVWNKACVAGRDPTRGTMPRGGIFGGMNEYQTIFHELTWSLI